MAPKAKETQHSRPPKFFCTGPHYLNTIEPRGDSQVHSLQNIMIKNCGIVVVVTVGFN